MTIDEIFSERYGFSPEGYYCKRLRDGTDAQAALREINEKIAFIWDHEKHGGFYPVNETDLPEGFI